MLIFYPQLSSSHKRMIVMKMKSKELTSMVIIYDDDDDDDDGDDDDGDYDDGDDGDDNDDEMITIKV